MYYGYRCGMMQVRSNFCDQLLYAHIIDAIITCNLLAANFSIYVFQRHAMLLHRAAINQAQMLRLRTCAALIGRSVRCHDSYQPSMSTKHTTCSVQTLPCVSIRTARIVGTNSRVKKQLRCLGLTSEEVRPPLSSSFSSMAPQIEYIR